MYFILDFFDAESLLDSFLSESLTFQMRAEISLGGCCWPCFSTDFLISITSTRIKQTRVNYCSVKFQQPFVLFTLSQNQNSVSNKRALLLCPLGGSCRWAVRHSFSSHDDGIVRRGAALTSVPHSSVDAHTHSGRSIYLQHRSQSVVLTFEKPAYRTPF
jgi:hypothetical protein